MIVPSVWDEPLGLVMIEGALARVPLVASDVGGIGEAMHDEEHALLFPRGDAEAAARALLRVTAGRPSRHQRAWLARTSAPSRFASDPYLESQERFVCSMLSPS